MCPIKKEWGEHVSRGDIEAQDGREKQDPAIVIALSWFEVDKLVFIGFDGEAFQEFTLMPTCFICKNLGTGKQEGVARYNVTTANTTVPVKTAAM